MKKKFSAGLALLLAVSLCLCSCRKDPTPDGSSSTPSGTTRPTAGEATQPSAGEPDPTLPDDTDPSVPADDPGGNSWDDPGGDNGNQDPASPGEPDTPDIPDDPDTPEDPDDPKEEGEPLYIDSHAIVYSGTASERQQVMVGKMQAVLNEKYTMNILYADNEEEAAPGTELLVGNTDRPASRRAMERLTKNRANNANDYIILVDEGDVVINAVSDYALQEAIDYFLATYCRGEFPEVPSNLERIHTPAVKAGSHQIAGVDITSYAIVTPWDKSFIYSREIDQLVDTIRKTTGYEIPVVDDRTKEQPYEILVGDTNRTQSGGSLAADRYILEQKGQKIVARGGHTYSTATAVRALTDLVSRSVQSSGTVRVASGVKTSGTYTPASGDYKLVWGDEFNGSALDESKWERTVETAAAWNGGTCYRTNELKNSRVENGNLIIQGNKNGENSFDSAKLRTNNSLTYVYGYLEIRAKLPAGKGLWPGFWLNAGDLLNPAGMPEVDVFEVFGTSNTIESAAHKWWRENQQLMHVSVSNIEPLKRSYTLPDGKLFHDDYHTFGFEWTPEYLHFYIDGHNYVSLDIRKEDMEPFHHPMFVILSLAIGLPDIPAPDETNDWSKATYSVDWIHLYQKPGVGQLNLLSK